MSEVKSERTTPASAAAPPSLGAVLDGADGLDRLGLITRLRADQQRRWQAGDRVPAEAYLREVAALRDDPELAIDLIFSEFLLRRDVLREAPALGEYLGRFPEHATVLRHQLELDALAQEAADTQGRGDRAPATVAAPPEVSDWTVVGQGNGPAAGPPAGAPALPGYEVLGELGRGGMGVVYKARQTELNRLVALKMIRDDTLAGEQELARFRAEAETVARLQHPNIVPIYQVGAWAGRPFFALEFVDGGNLAQRLAGTPQAPRHAAQLAEVLARAVHYAHERRIVHRDLKPANVLLARSQRPEAVPLGGGPRAPACYEPKVADFGLAKLLDGAPGADALRGQTRTGAILGTPSYMAPELAEGRVHQVGPAADVYALGAILYEMLTGRPPFLGETPLDTLQQVRSREPISPRQLQPKVPRDLETICLKCLHKEPPRRYASAEALADDLRHYLAGEPIRARPTSPWGRAGRWARRRPAVAFLLGLVVAVAAVGFGLVTWQWQRAEAIAEAEEKEKRNAQEQKRQADEATRRAEESAHVADEQRRAAAAALEQTEVLLAEGLLRPVGPEYRSLLYPSELSALWELAALPKERERVRLLFIERALDRPGTAEQLGRRAVLASHAAVGLDRGRRDQVLKGVCRRLRDRETDPRTRTVCALVVSALSPPDENSAREAIQAVFAAMSKVKSPDAVRPLADSLVALANRMSPDETAAAVDKLSDVMGLSASYSVILACADALTVLAGRMEDGAARRKAAAVATPRLLNLLGKSNPEAVWLPSLVKALLALPCRGEEEQVRRAAAAAAEDYLRHMLTIKDPTSPQHVARWLASVLAAVEKKEAPRIATRAAAHLTPDLTRGTRPLDRESAAVALVALLRHMEEGEARKAADAAVALLLDDSPRAGDPVRLREGNAKAVTVLAPWLSPEAAAAAATKVIDAHAGTKDVEYRASLALALAALAARLDEREAVTAAEKVLNTLAPKEAPNSLASALPALAGRVGKRDAAGVARRVSEAVVNPPEWDGPRHLVLTLAALADRLDEAEAEAAARLLANLVSPDRDPFSQQPVAAALGVLAGRLEPGKAHAVCGPAAAKLLTQLARSQEPRPWDAPCSAALAELVPRLEEGEARKAVTAAAATLFRDLAAAGENVIERSALAAALVALVGRMSKEEVAPAAARLLAVLTRADDGPHHRLILLDFVGALADRIGKEEAALAAAKVLDALAENQSDQGQERFLPVLRALADRLDRQGLVEALKHSGCVRGARAVILRCCERQTGQKFADVWELIDWLSANDAGVDVLSPPHAPPS